MVSLDSVVFWPGSRVTAPSINYQTTQIPIDPIKHFVKKLGLGETFNAVHVSVSLLLYSDLVRAQVLHVLSIY